MAVEWKKLNDVCSVHTGTQLNKEKMLEDGVYPVINGGQTSSGYTNAVNEKANSITISQGGESAGFVNWIDTDFWAGAHCYVLCDYNIDKRYLFHFLKSREKQIRSKRQGAGIPGLNRKSLMSLNIPVPSTSQQMILASKLDTFTSLVSKLNGEIELRKKQFEHYRDTLLDLQGKEGVEIKCVAHLVKDRVAAKNLNEKNYTSVENLLKDKAGRRDAETVPTEGHWIKYQKDDILIGNIRPYLRKIWLSDKEGGTNGDVAVIHVNDTIIPEFMYHCLASERFFMYYNQSLKDGKMPRGDKNRILSFKIPIIDKDDQSNIVTILNAFSTLISKLEEERDLHQKQYEYYREKLLTFE